MAKKVIFYDDTVFDNEVHNANINLLPNAIYFTPTSKKNAVKDNDNKGDIMHIAHDGTIFTLGPTVNTIDAESETQPFKTELVSTSNGSKINQISLASDSIKFIESVDITSDTYNKKIKLNRKYYNIGELLTFINTLMENYNELAVGYNDLNTKVNALLNNASTITGLTFKIKDGENDVTEYEIGKIYTLYIDQVTPNTLSKPNIASITSDDINAIIPLTVDGPTIQFMFVDSGEFNLSVTTAQTGDLKPFTQQTPIKIEPVKAKITLDFTDGISKSSASSKDTVDYEIQHYNPEEDTYASIINSILNDETNSVSTAVNKLTSNFAAPYYTVEPDYNKPSDDTINDINNISITYSVTRTKFDIIIKHKNSNNTEITADTVTFDLLECDDSTIKDLISANASWYVEDTMTITTPANLPQDKTSLLRNLAISTHSYTITITDKAVEQKYYYYAGWDCPRTEEELASRGTLIGTTLGTYTKSSPLIDYTKTPIIGPDEMEDEDYYYVMIPSSLSIYDSLGNDVTTTAFNKQISPLTNYNVFKSKQTQWDIDAIVIY